MANRAISVLPCGKAPQCCAPTPIAHPVIAKTRRTSHCSLAIGQFCCAVVLFSAMFCAAVNSQSPAPEFRPPAIPLVAHDPYFSIWSMADHLTDGPTRHWTGAPQQLFGLACIDGKNYRFLGAASHGRQSIPALDQESLELSPTHTVAVMTSPEVEIRVEFMT